MNTIGYVKAVTAAVDVDAGDHYRAFLGDTPAAHYLGDRYTHDWSELQQTIGRMGRQVGDIFDGTLSPAPHNVKWA